MKIADLQRHAAAIAHEPRQLEDLCLTFDALLRRALPYAVAAWSTHDPATGLYTSCTVTGLPKDPAREAELFRHEFTDGEPGSVLSMIAQRQAVTVLSQITGGDLRRAARFRHLLEGFGVTDELRALATIDETTWGSVSFYRVEGTFSSHEAQILATLSPTLADGLRLVLLRTAATRPEAVSDPPGILQVRPDGEVTALTQPARTWLERAGPQLATAANVTAAAVRNNADWTGAHTRLSAADGGLLSLHAASMVSDDGTVAVVVAPARPADVGRLLVDAYNLTPRQRDVLGRLLLGRSMSQIAAELGISEHTANDHRKAIYRRTGVSSRSELAALLQAEHYSPRSLRGLPPSPYGGFLEE